MRGGFLHVAQRDPGVQSSRDEGVPERIGRDGLADPGTARDLADDPPGAVPVQPPPVRSQEHRPAGTLADGQVNRPGGARCQRDGDYLAALTGNRQRPVPALQAEVLDVRAGGLGDPQPVQGEQGDQRMLGRRAEPGDQQSAELVAGPARRRGTRNPPADGGRARRVNAPGVLPPPRTCRTRRWCTAAG